MATQYSNKPIVTDGLVYALDFGNPKSYVSGSSSAYNLAYSNVTSSVITGSTLPIINGVAEFSGNTTIGLQQYVRSNSHFPGLFVDSGNGTVMFVARSLSTVDLNAIISQWNSPTYGTATGILFNTSTVSYGGADRPSLSRGYNGNFNSLNHFTFRLSSGSLDCFINGLPVSASIYAAGGPTNNMDNKLTIAHQFISNVNQRLLSGSLGILQIYNRPLTSDEIWNNYQLTAPRYGLGAVQNKPYTLDENAYLFLQSAGITDPIITSSIDTFVRGLKSASLWDKMIAIYPFVGTGSEGINLTGSHRWNLKEPSLVTYPLSFTGSWNGSTSGSAPSGSNTNISIGVITPSQYYPFFNTQSAHISILSYDTPVSSSYLMGTGMTEELAVSTLAGDYGTPAAAYSVRKVRTAYSGALMDVRRSLDNVTASIGYVSNGDLDTGSLLDWTIPGRNDLPGEYEGLAAAYSLRKVSASYDGYAVKVRGDIENQTRDIGFDAEGNLDTGSLLNFTATGSNTLPGDYSGLAAAYSLRKVVPGYAGDAIEVQSGTVSQSIGFDSVGNLDTGSLLTFAGSGDAFIKTWYDQSGNNRHAIQTTYANQPKIVSAGSVLTVDNKPAINFDGSNDQLVISSFLTTYANLAAFFVNKHNVISDSIALTLHDGIQAIYFNWLSGTQDRTYYGAGFIYTGASGTANTDRKLTTIYSNSTDGFLLVNGTQIGTRANGASINNNHYISGYVGGDLRANMATQELLIYTSSQVATRPLIENNINAYYNIYTTSSVSTENAFVSTWYDQSGNNRHATQTTASRQPLIVSSGSVITDGTRPMVKWSVSQSLTYIGNFTVNSVAWVAQSTSSDSFSTILNTCKVGGLEPGVYGAINIRAAGDTYKAAGFGVDFNDLSNDGGETYYNGNLYAGSSILNRHSGFVEVGPNTGFAGEYRAANGVQIGTHYSNDRAWKGYIGEILMYSGSQAANRPLIENNINNYYQIYTGSNHGFVARWYDQSGNNRHATQSVAVNQPLIVLSGSLITRNSRPIINFTTQSQLGLTSEVNVDGTDSSLFMTYEKSATGNQIPLGKNGGKFLWLNYGSIQYYGDTSISNAEYSTNNDYMLVSFTMDYNVKLTGYKNNIVRGIATSGFNLNQRFDKIFDRVTGATGSNSFTNEIVVYPTDQDINTQAINYGINSYYNIYPQTSSFTTSSFTIKADPTSISGSINNKLTSGISTSGPLGLITVSRTGSNSLTLARNGVTSSFDVPASGALSTGIYLGAINNNGIALGNSPLNISFASVGTGLTNSETSTYFNLVDTLNYGLGRGINSEYTALLSYATSLGYALPSSTQRIYQNRLITQLKQFGIWDKLDAFYLFATDGDQNIACLNWKNLGANTISLVNGPFFTANQGFIGDGIDSYLDTNFIPATHGVNYKLNDASRSVWVYTANSSTVLTAASDGQSERTNNYSSQRFTINSGTNKVGVAVGSGTGLISAYRASSATAYLYNNTTVYDLATASTVLSTSSIRLITAGGLSRISMFSMGASLISENSNYINTIQAYLNSISSL